MARRKTSQAVIKSVRFNPETSEDDRRALAIIHRFEEEGYTFKQIVMAVLKEGYNLKPTKSTASGLSVAKMEELLTQYTQEVIAAIRASGVKGIRIDDDSDTDSDTTATPFMRNFARSFAQRQQRALGEDE